MPTTASKAANLPATKNWFAPVKPLVEGPAPMPKPLQAGETCLPLTLEDGRVATECGEIVLLSPDDAAAWMRIDATGADRASKLRMWWTHLNPRWNMPPVGDRPGFGESRLLYVCNWDDAETRCAPAAALKPRSLVTEEPGRNVAEASDTPAQPLRLLPMDHEPDFHRGLIDGLPVWCFDLPGPCHAVLRITLALEERRP